MKKILNHSNEKNFESLKFDFFRVQLKFALRVRLYMSMWAANNPDENYLKQTYTFILSLNSIYFL